MNALALLRRDIPDRHREFRMSCSINGSMFDPGARRVVAEEVVTLPVFRWSDGSRDEPAAAVRANVTEDIFNARRAERALVRAHARLERVGRQRLVAVFAGRAELEIGRASCRER